MRQLDIAELVKSVMYHTFDTTADVACVGMRLKAVKLFM